MTARVSSGSTVTAHREGKSKGPSSFVSALNRRRRSRKPGQARSNDNASSNHLHPRRAPPSPCYARAARLQPKMWKGGEPKPGSKHRIVRKRSRGKISGEEPAQAKPQDQENEAHQAEDKAPGPTTAAAVAEEELTKKKARCVSPSPSSAASPSFLTSDLLRRRYGGGGLMRRCSLKAVTFADPIVAEVRIRPRTPRREVSKLFYSRSDEAQFRMEARIRRSMKTMCGARSSDEEETEEEDCHHEEVVAVVVACADNGDEHQDKSLLVPPSQSSNVEVYPNEITESDDSSGSSDEDTDDLDVQ
mmetsp:Transcript_17164/g.49668  ORF Transcript_17164/g.49668 Transcript_17164/m.49668 type:complete len:303 (-) Transcript_17164:83-991(-)